MPLTQGMLDPSRGFLRDYDIMTTSWTFVSSSIVHNVGAN